MWHQVRARRLAGFRFRRQHPIGPYVVDFVCLEAHLVIEVDGPTHENPSRDQQRDQNLASRGYATLRFWNEDVYDNLEGVIETILDTLVLASPAGGRGA